MLLGLSVFTALAVYPLCCVNCTAPIKKYPLLDQLEHIDVSLGRSGNQIFESVGPALEIDISDYGQFLSIYRSTSTPYYKTITRVIEYLKTKDAKKLREFLAEKKNPFKVGNKAFIKAIGELVQELDRKRLHSTCASNQGNPPKQTEPTIDQKLDSKPVNFDTAKSTILPAALTTNVPTVNPIEPVANMPPHPTTGSTTQSSLAHQHSAWKRLIELRDLAKRDEMGLDEKIYRIFRGSRAIITTAMSAGDIYLTIIDEAKQFLRAPEREHKFVDFLACTLVSKKRAKKGMKARLFSILRGFYQARIVAPFANTTKFPLLASLDEIKKLAKNPDTLFLWIDLFLYPKGCKIRDWGYYFHMVAEVFSEYFKTNNPMALLANLTILQAIGYDNTVPLDSFINIGSEICRKYPKLDTMKKVQMPVAIWDQLELIKRQAADVDNSTTNKLLAWEIFQTTLNRFDHSATTTHLCPELVTNTLDYASGLISPTSYIEFLFKLARRPYLSQTEKYPISEIISGFYKHSIAWTDQTDRNNCSILAILERIGKAITLTSLRQLFIAIFMFSFGNRISPDETSFRFLNAAQNYLDDMNACEFIRQLGTLHIGLDFGIQRLMTLMLRELCHKAPFFLSSGYSKDEKLLKFEQRHPKLRYKPRLMSEDLYFNIKHYTEQGSACGDIDLSRIRNMVLPWNQIISFYNSFQSSNYGLAATAKQVQQINAGSDSPK